MSFQGEVGICISILKTNDTTGGMSMDYKQFLNPGQVLQLKGDLSDPTIICKVTVRIEFLFEDLFDRLDGQGRRTEHVTDYY